MAEFLKSDVKDFTIDIRLTGEEAALLLELLSRHGLGINPLSSLREVLDNNTYLGTFIPAKYYYGWDLESSDGGPMREYKFVKVDKSADPS